jgi:AcrR family transcriptional regulator
VSLLPGDVKGGPATPSRSYDASRRRAAADRRRDAVLAGALRLFRRDGFATTTVAAVAAEAGVSQETIYKTFGGKAGLIEALYRSALVGGQPIPAYERSERLRLEADPHDVLRGWSRLAMEVAPQVASIQLLVRDASLVEPGLQPLLEELDQDRLSRMVENARFLHDAGHLREGVHVDEAADLMWAVTAPEVVELVVRRRGWSLERYADFVYETLAAGLLPRVERSG